MPDMIEQAVRLVRETRPRSIVALTGAGVSAESGIPTFRGAGGLWQNFRAEDLATPQAFARDPGLVWKWYEWRRELVRKAEPNAAHRALAELERSDRVEVTVVTQNVDGLHRRAGSRRLVELHGNIFRVRCTREHTIRERVEPFEELPPRCECGALLRPHIVWFGEMLDPADTDAATAAVASADLVMTIGTSGLVYPAAGLLSMCRRDSTTIEVNPEATPLSGTCDIAIRSAAGTAVPHLVEAILGGGS